MLSTEMNVITSNGFGDADVLQPSMRQVPMPGRDEVLIRVAAAGLNRADILQRKGKYPAPTGASDILGMEISGVVAAIGADVRQWKIGDKVCALLSGGGYAEYAVASESHCLPVPNGLTLLEAALLPEAVVTVYANIFETAALKAGDITLIHGGSSGIGTTAIQMAKLRGARVFVTAGSADKCAACLALGAEMAINYTQNDFAAVILVATNGRGVDIILDMVGGDYIARNLSILSTGGRHISIGTQHGAKVEVDLSQVMQKRLVVTGSTLRGRDTVEKARLIDAVAREIWPWVAAGSLKPVIFQSFPLKNATEAHKVMEKGAHIGKIGLEVSVI